MKVITKGEISFTLTCLEEHAPVRGNALASGDDAEDRKAEDKIIRRLDKGNQWAWCTVKLVGRFKSLESVEYLGCCSYKSERDFVKNSGYYDDMVDAIVFDINEQAAEIVGAVS